MQMAMVWAMRVKTVSRGQQHRRYEDEEALQEILATPIVVALGFVAVSFFRKK